ncbi:hypothetical protein GQ457_02G027990 [Hibiscus cannabinus]
MPSDSPSLTAFASVPGTTQPSVVENNSRPDADPPDPGRNHDPMSLGQSSDMDVSSPEDPAQNLVLPVTAMHPTSPMSSSKVFVPAVIPAPASYKDTLMASDSFNQAMCNVFTDNEEVKLVDGDVTRSVVDGLISIVFSERVQALAVKNFDLTVVVKLLDFRLMDIENDYFLVTFKSSSDFSNAISGGPWVLFGHYLVVEPWTVDFSTSQSHPNRVLAWIRLTGLPVTLYQRSKITAIGECIGPVIKIDYQTESGCRGRFARMAISLDLRKPLVSKLFINGRLQVVEYESLPTICFECGKYGHVKDMCPIANTAGADSVTSIEPVASTPSMTDEPFGPWMKVERRQRRIVHKDASGKQTDSGFVITQSRFNPIFEDEAPVEQDTLAAHHSPIPAAEHSNSNAQGSPLSAVEDPRGKGKAFVNSPPVKSRSSTPVRKSLTVQRSYAASTSKSGPLPSRRNSSLSGTRFAQFPRPVSRLNKSNHSAVVVSETDAPVILKDGSIPPMVPNTLLGAIKPPNLVDRQLQPLSLPILAGNQNASLQSAQSWDHWNWKIFWIRRSFFGARNLALIGFLGATRTLHIFTVKLNNEKSIIMFILCNYLMVHGVMMSKSYVLKPLVSFKLYTLIRRFLLDLILSLGNVLNVNVWNDTWVPSLGPLRLWLRRSPLAVASLTFDDLLLHNWQWDVNRLSDLLFHEAIPFVVGIPPPLVGTCDVLSWNSTLAGNFIVVSAYARLLELVWEAIDPKWSWVWSLAVTPRIRMFIWLLLKQRLMTNEERCRRGFSFDASCPCCGCVSESIIHILQDCPRTRSLWYSIVTQDHHVLFFTAPLETWVVSNIRAKSAIDINSIPWSCFYPSLLWQLWKRRNDFVFTGTCLPLVEVYKIGFAWATHFAEAIIVDRSRAAPMTTYLQWAPPALGWVCLNADASISPITGIGSIGGVLRNATGTWICGYKKCVGVVSILQAELWSVFVGLQVARSSGVACLIVQSDSSHAIKLLLDSSTNDHSMSLVRAIGILCQGSWQVDFQWILREMNMVADYLSKLPPPPQFCLLVTSDIPEAAKSLLDRIERVLLTVAVVVVLLELCLSFAHFVELSR